MTITRWNPVREINQLQREINRLFDGSWDDSPAYSRFSFLPGRAARSYPLLNVREEADGYSVAALAPGIAPDSIKVSVAGNQLTIEGEKTAGETEIKSEAYHRTERAAGRFVRSLTLPTDINADAVKATYKHGLLRIELPKAESAKPRQISVGLN